MKRCSLLIIKEVEIQTTMIYYLFVHIFMYNFCTWMFIATLFIIAKKWKQPKCPSADECIKKCDTCIRWNISAIKKDEVLILIHVTCVNLENIMLSEKSHLCEMSRIGRSIETESRLVVARSWGGRIRGHEWGMTNGYKVSF